MPGLELSEWVGLVLLGLCFGKQGILLAEKPLYFAKPSYQDAALLVYGVQSLLLHGIGFGVTMRATSPGVWWVWLLLGLVSTGLMIAQTSSFAPTPKSGS